MRERKEKASKETEKRARTRALRWGRTWFVPGPVGRPMCLKPRKAREPGHAGGLYSDCDENP